jgi:hypothetical protein
MNVKWKTFLSEKIDGSKAASGNGVDKTDTDTFGLSIHFMGPRNLLYSPPSFCSISTTRWVIFVAYALLSLFLPGSASEPGNKYL